VYGNSAALGQILLRHGADMSVRDNGGENTLFKAVRIGHLAMLKRLVSYGLSVYTVEHHGVTLLIMAASASDGHKDVAEWLVQQGVAVDAVTSLGSTALMHLLLNCY
jgi:uncharacterized protein